jgi:hypothetical protein
VYPHSRPGHLLLDQVAQFPTDGEAFLAALDQLGLQ